MKVDNNRIKQAIISLDSGEFQNFCEQYLHLNGYKFITSKGGKPGTNITKPGTPDHICISENNRYILVEDTTQKGKGIRKKIKDDVEKCVLKPKHGLPINEVERLIYFYNQGLDDETIINECKKICQSKNISFDFISLERLANDLFENPVKYSRMAKTILKIDLSFFGVLSLSEFIDQNERIKRDPSLSTSFFGRTKEIEESIKAVLSGCSILILGNPGVGKTRLAIEVCYHLLKKGYFTVCLNGNSNINIKDLIDAISCIDSDKVIVFIDDANEFSQLDSMKNVISYFDKQIVFIITVRRHEISGVEDRINNITTVIKICLHPFSREETKEFLEMSFGIKNLAYINRIYTLSIGNQRLITLAAKLALEERNISSISDASTLYDAYYGSVLHNLGANRELMMTLGIVAFENHIDLDSVNYIIPLFQEVGLSINSFFIYCRQLSIIEILEIEKNVVRFTDQTFKCFIQKKVFVDDKVLPLGLFIKRLYFIHPEVTKSEINSLLSVFQNPSVNEFVTKEVQELADDPEIQNNEEFLSFFSFFCPLFPMKALRYVVKTIETLESHSSTKCVTILGILGSLSRSDEINDVIELLFQILNKRKELLPNVSQLLTNTFSFRIDSRFNYYSTQEAVLKKFNDVLNRATQVELDLIKTVVPEYIKTHYNYMESAETVKKVIIRQFDLPFDAKISELRTMAWRIIFALPNFKSTIEEILINYGRDSFKTDIDERIGRSDWKEIESYVKNSFDSKNLKHCIIVKHLSDMIPSILNSETLKPFFSSNCFLIYREIDEIINAPGFYDFENYILPQSFVKTIEEYDLADFLFLFDIFRDMKTISIIRQPDYLIPFIFGFLEHKKEIDLIELSLKCVNNGIAEGQFFVKSIYSILTKRYPESVILAFINTIDEKYRNNWLWEFFIDSSKQVDGSAVKDFYKYLDTPDTNLTIIGFRNILDLDQYIRCDSSFIYHCLSIIAKNYDLSPFLYSSYLKVFFLKDPVLIVELFNNDFDLLFKCYCYVISDRGGIEDYDGRILAYVSSLSITFLEKYLFYNQENKNLIHDPYGKLKALWATSCFIEFADYIYYYARNVNDYYIRYSIYNCFFESTNEKNNEILNNKKQWVYHLIDSNKENEKEMLGIASFFEYIPMDIRIDCIVYYVNESDDIELFKKIELVPYGGSWAGSQIPMLTEKKKNLEKLKERLNQPRFLKHRIVVESYIDYYDKNIRKVEKDELMDDW